MPADIYSLNEVNEISVQDWHHWFHHSPLLQKACNVSKMTWRTQILPYKLHSCNKFKFKIDYNLKVCNLCHFMLMQRKMIIHREAVHKNIMAPFLWPCQVIRKGKGKGNSMWPQHIQQACRESHFLQYIITAMGNQFRTTAWYVSHTLCN